MKPRLTVGQLLQKLKKYSEDAIIDFRFIGEEDIDYLDPYSFDYKIYIGENKSSLFINFADKNKVKIKKKVY